MLTFSDTIILCNEIDHRRPWCHLVSAAQVSTSGFTNYVGFVFVNLLRGLLGDKATFHFQTKTWLNRRLVWLCDFVFVCLCFFIIVTAKKNKKFTQYSTREMDFRFNTAEHSCAQLSLRGSREGCFPFALFCSRPLGMINVLVLQNDVV